MAIYHCNISVATRGSGASAVAGAAYISRSAIRSEHEMQTYDYSRAHNYEQLVTDLGVALPPGTPARFADRSTLWNEVEKIEKKSDAQLCRRIETALPDELPRDAQIELAQDIVAERVADGHVVDACIHSNDDGSNTHLHMLEPLRRCNESGFLPKSENIYTVRNTSGDEQQCNAAQFKELKELGYEKVYKYRKGNEWRELTATEARAWDGCKRHSKTPIQQTRYLNNGWNDQRMAEIWRSDIATAINAALEAAGEDARVDHRSYERQGIEQVPTVHEGAGVRAEEKAAQLRATEQGYEYEPVTDRRRENIERQEVNREIAVLHQMQAILETLKTGAKSAASAVAQTLSRGFARAREDLRDIFALPETSPGYDVRRHSVEMENAKRYHVHVAVPEDERRRQLELEEEERQRQKEQRQREYERDHQYDRGWEALGRRGISRGGHGLSR